MSAIDTGARRAVRELRDWLGVVTCPPPGAFTGAFKGSPSDSATASSGDGRRPTWLESLRIPLGDRPRDRQPARDEAPVPDWVAASPARILRAWEAASRKPCGGWFAVEGSRRIGKHPKTFTISGRDVVLWRDEQGLHAAPEACPHMGASLAGAAVRDGCLVCPWHGLSLGPAGHGAWHHLPAFDDGTLVWIQLPGEAPLARPVLPVRPRSAVDAVVRLEGQCEPEHIIRNRLDPWHGAHFHPYAFCDLEVIHADDERLRMNVAYRAFGPLVVDVVAEFTTPSARCIAMHIVDGEGRGSLVETHATPLGHGRSAVVEATFATSERDGFGLARRLGAVIRPFMERSARRLWDDDVAYAERLASIADGSPGPSTLRATRTAKRAR